MAGFGFPDQQLRDQRAPMRPPDAQAGPAKAADSNYIIGPGDTLQVFVWRNPELSVTVPVRPDGKISTPLVEDMVAVGKTSPQLARDMEAVLGGVRAQPQGQHHRHDRGELPSAW